MKVIALPLLLAPMMAMAGGGVPDPATHWGAHQTPRSSSHSLPTQIAAANVGGLRDGNYLRVLPATHLSFSRSPPLDPDAIRNAGWPVAQLPRADAAMPHPTLTQGHSVSASHDSTRWHHLAGAPLILSVVAGPGDGVSSTGTGSEGFAGRIHVLRRANGAQPVGHGIAYTVSGKEYIAIARWHRKPAFVVVFALP